MKKTLNLVDELIEEVLLEQEWNKDSNTPRDYSQEYNPPGSKEQEERNKRKRDKRKHDKENGECPEGEELHHVNGIEEDEVECEPSYINRGRKEKSRLKKGEIVIKIEEHQLKKIIQEETEEILNEIFPALAGLMMRGGAMLGRGAASAGGAAKTAARAASRTAKQGAKMAKQKISKEIEKKMMDKAIKGIEQADTRETPEDKAMAKKMAGTKVGSFDQLSKMIDQVLMQASDEDLTGNPSELINKLKASIPVLDKLKTAETDTAPSPAEQASQTLPTGGPIPWTPTTAAEKAEEPAEKVSGAAEKAMPIKPEEKPKIPTPKPLFVPTSKKLSKKGASHVGMLKKTADKVKKKFKNELEKLIGESEDATVSEVFDLVVQSRSK